MIGWYYECGTVQDTDSDAWALIGRAVEEAADDGRLHALLVGPMEDPSAAEYIDEEDALTYLNDGCSAERIREDVSERFGDRVYEGRVHVRCSDREAQEALERAKTPRDVVAWAMDYLECDPSEYCDGRDPLPIEWIEGEWNYGDRRPEPPEAAACITYAEEPSPETGHVGWCWWALGKMGEAKSLKEAMAKCEAVIRAWMEIA